MVTATDVQMKAEEVLELFRARYNALIAGVSGSPDGRGDGILRVRSGTAEAGQLIAYAIELLSGCGEIPDANLLRSSAANMDVKQDAFTCTVLSLVMLMDAIHSMNNGGIDTVDRMFEIMMHEGEQPHTSGNMSSRTHTIPVSTQFPVPVPSSMPQDGMQSNPARSSKSRGKTNAAKKQKTKKIQSGTKKPSAKKRRKSKRK